MSSRRLACKLEAFDLPKGGTCQRGSSPHGRGRLTQARGLPWDRRCSCCAAAMSMCTGHHQHARGMAGETAMGRVPCSLGVHRCCPLAGCVCGVCLPPVAVRREIERAAPRCMLEGWWATPCLKGALQPTGADRVFRRGWCEDVVMHAFRVQLRAVSYCAFVGQ